MTHHERQRKNREQFPGQELEQAVYQATALISLLAHVAAYEEYRVIATGAEIAGVIELQHSVIDRLAMAREAVNNRLHALEKEGRN